MRVVFAGTPEPAVTALEAIDEQHAVQVVGLVLDGPGQQVRPLDRHRLAVHVEPACHNAQRPTAVEHDAGQRQAPLLAVLHLVGEREVGVDEVADLTVDVPGEHPQPDPELRSCEPGTGGVEHGVGEVLHQPAELGVEVGDRLRGRAEHGVAEEADRLEAHR